MKKLLGILLAVLIIAAILLYLGKGFGFGGTGSGTGTSGQTQESVQASSQAAESTEEIGEEVISNVVTVTIKEDKVYVGEQEFADEAAFKTYIESINNDQREIKLVEEDALQGTFDWVVKVLDELKVKYTRASE